MEVATNCDELIPGQRVRLLYSPVMNALGICVWVRPRQVEAADPTKRTLVALGFLLDTGNLVQFDWHPAMRANVLT